MKRFSSEEIIKKLAQMPGWKWDTGFLCKTFVFENVTQTALFLNAVRYLAEMEDHHPSFVVNTSEVTLSLQTRAAKGLTQKDFEMARKIEGLAP